MKKIKLLLFSVAFFTLQSACAQFLYNTDHPNGFFSGYFMNRGSIRVSNVTNTSFTVTISRTYNENFIYPILPGSNPQSSSNVAHFHDAIVNRNDSGDEAYNDDYPWLDWGNVIVNSVSGNFGGSDRIMIGYDNSGGWDLKEVYSVPAITVNLGINQIVNIWQGNCVVAAGTTASPGNKVAPIKRRGLPNVQNYSVNGSIPFRSIEAGWNISDPNAAINNNPSSVLSKRRHIALRFINTDMKDNINVLSGAANQGFCRNTADPNDATIWSGTNGRNRAVPANITTVLTIYRACPPPPSNPNNLQLVGNANARMLSWQNATGSSGTQIRWAKKDAVYNTNIVQNTTAGGGTMNFGNGTTFVGVYNLEAGVEYKWSMRTKCFAAGDAYGDWSEDQIFKLDIPSCGGTARDERPDVAQNKVVDVRWWLTNAMSKTFEKVKIIAPDNSSVVLPAGTYTYNFPVLGSHKVEIITKRADGSLCMEPLVYPFVSACTKCLEDGSAGQNRSTFYCFANDMASYNNLYLRYDCPNLAYRTYYTTGSALIDLPVTRNVRQGLNAPNMMSENLNPENLRPACNNAGGLKENTYSFKYSIPKSNPAASSKMDYIIPTNFNLGGYGNYYRYRTIVNVDQGASNGSKLFVQRQKMAQSLELEQFTTIHVEDLQSNMAKAPGSPTPYGAPQTPSHEFYSIPTALNIGFWTYGKGSPGPWWTEKLAIAGNNIEYDCRTFELGLDTNSNVRYRVRVCDPCAIIGVFTLSEADLSISFNGSLANDTNKKIGESSGEVSGQAKATIYLKTNNNFLSCVANNKIASAIPIGRLPNTCPPASRISNPNNTKLSENERETESKPSTFPNPFTTELNIKFTAVGGQEAYFEVFDLTGKQLYNSKVQKLEESGFVQETLDTSNWATGMYVVKTFAGNGESSTQKVVKQ